MAGPRHVGPGQVQSENETWGCPPIGPPPAGGTTGVGAVGLG